MTTLDQAFAALKAAEVAAEKSNQLFNELLKLTREVAEVKERANEEASRLAFIVEISDDVAAAAAAADKAQEAALSVKTAFDATNFATKIAKIAAAKAALTVAEAALTVAELEKFS
ncbi:MAG TPA: hypothetical protein PLK20_03370 [Paludibacteraceae bacterium]|nr:hypothetical protein [Paludibacteraceae bacterium]